MIFLYGEAIMRNSVTRFFLLFCIVSNLFGTEASLSFYFESKHDKIVQNFGLAGGFHTEVLKDDLQIVLDWQIRNYQAGDFKINFPLLAGALKLDKPIYFFLKESYFGYDDGTSDFKAGYFPLNEGTGQRYPLWISDNSDGYPAIRFEWNPERWFTFTNAILFMRAGVQDWDSADNLQTAKTLYYRKAGFRPFYCWEFGFEESMLFFGRTLDLPYLISFFPYQTMQELRNNYDSPWKERFNDNGMLGFYTKLYLDPVDLYGSIFIDDFNPTNLKAANNKLAWNAGLNWSITDNISLLLETAGASKYTYQRHSLSAPPYMYVRYETEADLPIEYNMIGYRYGPNSGVFNAELAYQTEGFGGSVFYEFLTYGKRAPFEQWDEPGGTMPVLTTFPWLNDSVLQFENTIGLTMGWDFAANATINGSLGLTFVNNDGLEKGKKDFRVSFSIGARYAFSLTDLIGQLW